MSALIWLFLVFLDNVAQPGVSFAYNAQLGRMAWGGESASFDLEELHVFRVDVSSLAQGL